MLIGPSGSLLTGARNLKMPTKAGKTGLSNEFTLNKCHKSIGD